MSFCALLRASGLSPLVRGTQDETDWPHAGQTVYPRSCGEHVSRRCPARLPARFIPARAGNTLTDLHQFRTLAVYPRSCGEHGVCAGIFLTACGLSPLVRGTQPKEALEKLAQRFIPARAGNTLIHIFLRLQLTVYPRSCGEHRLLYPVGWIACGLSPLVRGTPPSSSSAPSIKRFIPARAGNTVNAAIKFVV